MQENNENDTQMEECVPISVHENTGNSGNEIVLNAIQQENTGVERPITNDIDSRAAAESSDVPHVHCHEVVPQKIEKLSVTLPRKYIQGGLSNEEYDEHHLTDWRLQHHIVTDYFKKWQNYEKQGDDSKFTDCQSKDDKTKKAEGKSIKKTGVTFSPSVDVGANRAFNEDNLKECFKLNSHYYLYDRGLITETSIEFIIYMVPIELINEWYSRCGNRKGTITKRNIYKCIGQCEFDETTWKVE